MTTHSIEITARDALEAWTTATEFLVQHRHIKPTYHAVLNALHNKLKDAAEKEANEYDPTLFKPEVL